jgi:regulator of protease activity HflC (stomatin/prohibitin superfamily)
MKSNETIATPISGYTMLAVEVLIFLVAILGLILIKMPFFALLFLVFFLLIPGFFFVNPNGSRVLVLFGEYKGTVKNNGFFWVNPF